MAYVAPAAVVALTGREDCCRLLCDYTQVSFCLTLRWLGRLLLLRGFITFSDPAAAGAAAEGLLEKVMCSPSGRCSTLTRAH